MPTDRLQANQAKVEVIPSGPIRSDKVGSRQASSSRVHKGDSIPEVALQRGSYPEEER